MKQIPNLFTLLNLVLGFLAIISILQTGLVTAQGPAGNYLVDIPEKIWLASLFIGLAAVVDFFDGFVARLLHASSEMGKQLDSLADVVSFGVAPGLILYQFLRLSIASQENGLEASMLWMLPSVLIPCAAAYRLARFNIDTSQTYGFIGVPVPAAGLLIASFPLLYWGTNTAWFAELLLNKWFLYAVILIVSYLMISTLPIMAFKFKNYSWQHNYPKYILVLIALLAAIFLHWAAVPVVFLSYIIVSLAFKNKPA